MERFIELFKQRHFEVKISLLVCLLGVLRIGVAVVEDLIRSIVIAELATDSILLIIFSILFYIALTKPNFKGIHPVAGILMIIFLSFNFIEFAGVAGNSEFNILSAILGVACLFSGRWMYSLTFIIVVVITALQVIILYNKELMQSFFLYSSDQYSDFIFSIICVVAINQGSSALYPLLQISSSELKSVISTINGALKSDQKLDRSKLR